MRSIPATEKSLVELIFQLPEKGKEFVKQEIELAKKEMTEKIGRTLRRAVWLIVGAFGAYAGLLMLMAGFGFFVARILERSGLDPLLANFAGFGMVGLLSAITGGLVVVKGAKRLSEESLAPEKTLETLGVSTSSEPARQRENDRDEHKSERVSEEIQQTAVEIKSDLGETLDEIRERLTPDYVMRKVEQAVRAHPVECTVVSIGTALVGGFFLRRKLQRIIHS